MDNRLHQDIVEIKTDVKALMHQGAENTATLKEHIKRTELNEARIKQLEYWLLCTLVAAVGALLTRAIF